MLPSLFDAVEFVHFLLTGVSSIKQQRHLTQILRQSKLINVGIWDTGLWTPDRHTCMSWKHTVIYVLCSFAIGRHWI